LGTTVILTTHDISDVEKLCPRVIIIDEGQKLFDGDLQKLKLRFGGHHRLEVQFTEAVDALTVSGAASVAVKERNAVITFDPNQVSSGELIKALVNTHPVSEIDVRPPELETTIRKIYEQKLLRK